MTFHIVGDNVFYNGEHVLQFVDTPLLVKRDEVLRILDEWDGEVVDRTDDLQAAEEALEQRNEARALADARAMLLMIEPGKWDE